MNKRPQPPKNRKPEVQENAVFLCPHIYGFRDEVDEAWLVSENRTTPDSFADDLTNLNDGPLYGVKFNFCPLCGESLIGKGVAEI